MTAGMATILLSCLTYLLMVIAFMRPRHRSLHIPIMVSVIVYDAAMPIYLFWARDMYKRLILNGDIMTFGVWMHFGLVIVLYMLYAFQILTARRLMADNDREARASHRMQARGILLVRAFVILTGAFLYDAQYAR